MAKKNLFEMGANFDNEWSSDNKEKHSKSKSTEIKAPEEHHLYLAKEKRRGKVVTIVKPFFLHKEALHALAKTLKTKLGTGGTVKEERLEFQGDIPTQVRKHLEALGYGFKK